MPLSLSRTPQLLISGTSEAWGICREAAGVVSFLASLGLLQRVGTGTRV